MDDIHAKHGFRVEWQSRLTKCWRRDGSGHARGAAVGVPGAREVARRLAPAGGANAIDQSPPRTAFAHLNRNSRRIEEVSKSIKARSKIENRNGNLPHNYEQELHANLLRPN